ncbi:MAG: S-methyl-5-thioribose-1-phosphate isomerase [Methanotrichaceae archaeon]|nr:S-methyl-5-thioribose-1-phosphate isomerase [Methanotrichaceae archaeon]
MNEDKTIWWDDGLFMIDQTKLPVNFEIINIKSIRDLVGAIKSLKIRGAPALGAAGAYGIALAASLSKNNNVYELQQELEIVGDTIKVARPTAVNLSWGVDRILKVAMNAETAEEIKEATMRAAFDIAEEDIRINKALSRYGAKLLENGDNILTHCNAGRLACVGWGTALGVVRSAIESGKKIHVYACETRPLNQGSRLTAWELIQDDIPVTLICESSSGSLMRKGLINKVIVGADRITKNAVFNKIGTYNHAILAKAHMIPFYVAAPLSSFDLQHEEAAIEVEERDASELCIIGDVRLAPEGIDVYNPAFDATPIELVTALITERGIFRPPLTPAI